MKARQRRSPVQQDDPKAAERTRELIKETIDEIGRADAKAALLFTGAGVVLGAGGSVFVANADEFSRLSIRLGVPLLAALACAVAALTALAAASFPRGLCGPLPPGGSVTFFGDIVKLKDVADLRAALRKSNVIEDDALQQLQLLSNIAYRKYVYIRLAYILFGLMLLASIAALAVTLYP